MLRTRLQIAIAFVALTFITALVGAAQRSTASAQAIRLNNLGVGYMNQARIGEALQTFRRAVMQDPNLFAARLNEGIALLNLQRLDEARDVLLDATKRQAQSARAWYNLGIAYRTLAQADAAGAAAQQRRATRRLCPPRRYPGDESPRGLTVSGPGAFRGSNHACLAG